MERINWKRYSLMAIVVLMGIFTFFYSYEDTKVNMEESVSVTATPVSGKTVVLDAGHGVPDERSTK